MCGIFGFAAGPTGSFSGAWPPPSCTAAPMTQAPSRRRPSASVTTGLDVINHEGGHQPVANEDETVWLVYNGEVYNYRELRAELEAAGHTFRTHCDSGAIVHAYEEWGAACAARFNGMWAFAIADLRGAGEDGRGGKLRADAPDHFGIRPLYSRSPRTGRLLLPADQGAAPDAELSAEPDERLVFEYLRHGFHDHRAETFFRASTTCRRRPG